MILLEFLKLYLVAVLTVPGTRSTRCCYIVIHFVEQGKFVVVSALL